MAPILPLVRPSHLLLPHTEQHTTHTLGNATQETQNSPTVWILPNTCFFSANIATLGSSWLVDDGESIVITEEAPPRTQDPTLGSLGGPSCIPTPAL